MGARLSQAIEYADPVCLCASAAAAHEPTGPDLRAPNCAALLSSALLCSELAGPSWAQTGVHKLTWPLSDFCPGRSIGPAGPHNATVLAGPVSVCGASKGQGSPAASL